MQHAGSKKAHEKEVNKLKDDLKQKTEDAEKVAKEQAEKLQETTAKLEKALGECKALQDENEEMLRKLKQNTDEQTNQAKNQIIMGQESQRRIAQLQEENNQCTKTISEMNLEISKSNLVMDKMMLKLREFLNMHFGDKFDEGYTKIREGNPSKQAKLGLLVPMLELVLFSFCMFQAQNQSKQINIMNLSRSYNRHF